MKNARVVTVSVIANVLLLLIGAFSFSGSTHAVDIIAPCTAGAATEKKQNVVVHPNHYTDDLHAASMAVGLAKTMQERGHKVTLMLILEGVRLADSRTPQDLSCGHGDDISKAYDAFVKAGGEVIVCPHCAKAKETLTQKGFDFEEIVLSKDASITSVRAITGRETTPQVFIGGKHIGGNDDLQKYFANAK